MMKTMLNGKRWIKKLADLYKTDGRRHARLPAEFTGTMFGPFGTIYVTGIDLNRSGAGVHSAQELPLGGLVFLKIAELGVMGFAHVRHCSPRRDGYFLGVEFRDGLAREREEAGNWQRQRLAQSAHPAWDGAEF